MHERAQVTVGDETGPVVALPTLPRPTWERPYAWLLAGLDAGASAVAVLSAIALGLVSITSTTQPPSTARVLFDAALVLGWPAMLAVSQAYDPRVLGLGSREFRQVGVAALRMLATIAVAVFVFDLPVRPGYVLWAVGVALMLSLVGRYLARKQLHRRRVRGQYSRQVLAIGAPSHVAALVEHLAGVPYAGLVVVAAITDTGDGSVATERGPVPVLGRPGDVLAALAASGADTVALTDSDTLTGHALRQLAWDLEGTGIDLLVAPAVVEVAGPRIAVRALGGLPLLYVEEPQLTGGARLFKEVADRLGAACLLVVLSPLLAGLALAVRLGDRGPALFRQRRVGINGREFEMLKFRTMSVGAEGELDSLRSRNERAGSGEVFKVQDDPRVTRVGRVLRRRSLDELPQLWNVLRGQMSLVGPRPPLPSEVRRYDHRAHRRLLVKPGMTGLWQVSGRADLSWDDTVRLDLWYVENWSPALDGQLLWRTLPAVLRGHGAY